MTILLSALITAGFMSILDTLFSLLMERPVVYSTFIEMVTAMGIFGFFVILVWMLLWGIVAFFARRVADISAQQSAVLLSVFLITGFFALMLGRNIEVNTTFSMVILYALIAAMAYLVTILYYRVLSRSQDDIKMILPLFLLFTITALAFLVIWLIKYHIHAQFLKLLLLFGAAAISFLFYRLLRPVTTLKPVTVTVIVTSLLILAISAGGILSAHPFTVHFDSGTTTQHKIKHVILLTIDTLRADFVSCYNAQNSRTPNIDSIAEEGIRFENAMVTSPWTLPSFASLFTGLSPDVHMTTKVNHRLPDSLTTIAEVMRNNGYLTASIGLNKVLTGNYGTQQGFRQRCFYPKSGRGESYAAQLLRKMFSKRFAEKGTTTELTDHTIDWLQAHKDNDFFLWLHYYDPHLPYSPPQKYLPSLKLEQNIGNALDEDERISIRSGTLVPDAVEREWIRQLYIGEIHYVDDNVGRVVQALRDLGIYEDCLLIVLSDHGEEFWEHQGFAHGHTLYQELLHVPLIIKLPGYSHAQKTVRERVSLESIMPTLVELCELQTQTDLLKPSLASRWQDGKSRAGDEIIFATGMLFYEEQRAVLFDDFKYIQYMISDKELAYDLAADPFEERSVAASREEKTELAKKILQGHQQVAKGLRRQLGLGDESSIRSLDRETLEILKSIGYLQ